MVEYFDFTKSLESTEPTIVLDGNTLQALAANGSFCELVQRSFDDIIGKKIDFFAPSERGYFAFEKRSQPIRIITKSGSEISAEAVCLYVHQGKPPVVVLRILTDDNFHAESEKNLQNRHLALQRAHKELLSAYNRLELLTDELESKNRQLEELYHRLSHASRMATIGELTAGAAHGINNPLAAAVSALRGINRLAASIADETIRENIGGFCARADKALERIENIVNDLRRLARIGAKRGELKEVSLQQKIKMALDLLSHKLRDVEVVQNLPQTNIRVCPEEFLQVAMNLLDNAAYAMKGNGRLEISGELTDAGLVLRIADSGPGVPTEQREHIFEPFFTTKPPGEGTGMGLSMARGIIESYAGTLNLVDTEKPGCTFEIFLPAEVVSG